MFGHVNKNLKESVEAYLAGQRPPVLDFVLQDSGYEFLLTHGGEL